MDIQDLIDHALSTTEANAVIVGHAPATNRIWVLPCWECESVEALNAIAVANSITWADQNGAGPVEVYTGFHGELTE